MGDEGLLHHSLFRVLSLQSYVSAAVLPRSGTIATAPQRKEGLSSPTTIETVMPTKPNRRQVLIGTAAVAAGAVLPVTGVVAALPVAAADLPVQPLPVAEDYLGVYLSGCNRDVCNCWYEPRAYCPWGRHVWKPGDGWDMYTPGRKYYCGGKIRLTGHAGLGFKPRPDEADNIARQEHAREYGLPHPLDWDEKKLLDDWDPAKVEYARTHGLPSPYYWTEEQHDEWHLVYGPPRDLDYSAWDPKLGADATIGQADELWPGSKQAERAMVIVRAVRAYVAKANNRAEETVTADEIYDTVRRWGFSYEETVVSLQRVLARLAMREPELVG